MYFGFLREESVVTKSNIISSRLFFSFFDRKEKGERKVERERERKEKENGREERREEKKNDCPFLLDTLFEKEQKKIMLIFFLLYILLHLAGSLVAFDTTTENYTVPVSGKCVLTCYVAEVRSFKVSFLPFRITLSSILLPFCIYIYICLLQYDLLARRNCTVCWFNKLLCVC
jgi:hypothetical protein